MDIKSRNIKYSFIMKAVAVFLMWAAFAALFATAAFYGIYYEEITKEKYYDTYKFGKEFTNYIDSVIYSKEVQKLTGNTSETFIQNNKVAGYNISSAANFKYVIRNTQSGALVTNIAPNNKAIQNPVEEFSKNRTYLLYSAPDIGHSDNILNMYPDETLYLDDLEDALNHAPVEFYATVNDQLKPGDVFYDIQVEHKKIHDWTPMIIIIAITVFAIGLCSFIYLAVVTGRSEKNGEVKPALIDWLYNDLHTAAIVLAAVMSIGLANWVTSTFSDDISKGVGIFILLSIDMLIGLSYVLSVIRHIRRRTLFKHTLIYSLFKFAGHILAQCFAARTFKPAVILLLLAYGVLSAILFAIATYTGNGGSFWFIMLIILCFNIAVIYYVSKALTSLSGIMKWVKEMTKGNLEYALDTVNMSPAFTAFVKDIGSLQTGIKQAVSEAVKGERLKTELITNVSHDLKTPLTSIINYVDLLKKENLDNETINEYIGVLEDKSARLKQLVDDLLEASKAASGDMTVNFGNVDLCALAEQSVAEYSEKAADAKLDVRIKVCEKPAMVRGDGTLMWRIMDNLLSNVVKYSQKNSRVYIDIEDTGTSGVITIKNISEAVLDITSDQLLERFVRGDRARSTEGSGLGLSIAKSLVEIQGGTLNLKVDGDLFKVIVALPLETV